jgi:hypothetical protein
MDYNELMNPGKNNRNNRTSIFREKHPCRSLTKTRLTLTAKIRDVLIFRWSGT